MPRRLSAGNLVDPRVDELYLAFAAGTYNTLGEQLLEGLLSHVESPQVF